MGSTGGMYLKVNTETLESVAIEVEMYLKQLRETFNTIDKVVEKSYSYWEADGQNAYLKKYMSQTDMIDLILKGFQENVTDLRTIAGVYVAEENKAIELAQALSEDVII